MTVLAVALGITPGCPATRLRPKQSNRRLKHTFTPTPCQALPIDPSRDQIDAGLRRRQLAQAPVQVKVRCGRHGLLALLVRRLLGLPFVVAPFALLTGAGGFVAALRGQRVITMSNRYRLRQRVELALGEDSQLDVAIDTNTSFNAIMAARAGLGVALVEPATAYGMPIEGMVVKRLAVEIPFYFGVVTPYGKPVEGVTQRLIDAVEKAARSTLQGFVKRDASLHDELL